MKSDLCAVSDSNVIFKYADGTTLLVPKQTDVDFDIECNLIKIRLSLTTSSSIRNKKFSANAEKPARHV